MRFTKAQLRKRGRALFRDRLRAEDTVLGLVIGALPASVIAVMEEFCAAAYALGYEAGAAERAIVDSD